MGGYLPLHILELILHKLPLETLVLCTSVCKEWKSIITNPSFIADHIRHTIKANNGNQHLLLRLWIPKIGRSREPFSMNLFNEQLDFLSKVQYPFDDICPIPYSEVVGSCNGLVCLHNQFMGFIIWNPFLRKYMVLPKSNLHTYDNAFFERFGFGFDSKKNDFKVVRLVSHRSGEPCSPQVEVFSLATRCWKAFPGSKAPSFTQNQLVWTKQMFRDGVLHWAVRRNQTHENFIMTFDLVEETFGEIALPEGLRGKDNDVSVIEGGDFLTVWVGCIPHGEYYDVWVMKEYGIVESWTMLYTGIASISTPLIGFTKSENLLLYRCFRGEIVAVNYKENKVSAKKLRIRAPSDVSLICYSVSLFFIDQSTDNVISY